MGLGVVATHKDMGEGRTCPQLLSSGMRPVPPLLVLGSSNLALQWVML